jgi:hypothetical protein
MTMFNHAMFLELFQNVQRNVHQNSKDKGFWEGPENANVPTKLMLIVSELAEAMEEHRNYEEGSKLFKEIRYGYVNDEGIVQFEQKRDKETGKALLKPEGFAIEMADAVIRIMDLCEHLGIDLADAIMIKADYNRGREKMHGGKKY